MSEMVTVKVSKRNQIALPSQARKALQISAGDRLMVDVQDGMIILLPQIEDYVTYMAGLHKDVWADIDVTAYLQAERDAWQTSEND